MRARQRPKLALLGLPGLAGGVARVARSLALGGLGRVADQFLDGLLALARLALGLLDGLLLGASLRLGFFLGLARCFPLLARGRNLHTLLAPLEHVRIVGGGPRSEAIEHGFARIGRL